MHCVAVDSLLCVLKTKTFYTGLKPTCDCFPNISYCQNSVMLFIRPPSQPNHNKLERHVSHNGEQQFINTSLMLIICRTDIKTLHTCVR